MALSFCSMIVMCALYPIVIPIVESKTAPESFQLFSFRIILHPHHCPLLPSLTDHALIRTYKYIRITHIFAHIFAQFWSPQMHVHKHKHKHMFNTNRDMNLCAYALTLRWAKKKYWILFRKTPSCELFIICCKRWAMAKRRDDILAWMQHYILLKSNAKHIHT